MSVALLVAVGSGALTNAKCDAFASTSTDVIVIGRNDPKIESLCYVSSALSEVVKRPDSFRSTTVNSYESDEQIAQVLTSTVPSGVFRCASRQSPGATLPPADGFRATQPAGALMLRDRPHIPEQTKGHR